eukprot:1179373-Prorocentrum_minimum.AAC.1
MAYFVNLTNFLVTKHTSPLTLQVRHKMNKAMHNSEAKPVFGRMCERRGRQLNSCTRKFSPLEPKDRRTAVAGSALRGSQSRMHHSIFKHSYVLHKTVEVLGNAKGVVATVVSILIFRNPVSTAGMIGYTITIFGVILYSESKKRSVKQQKKLEIMEKDNDMVIGKQQPPTADHVNRTSVQNPR